MRILHTGDWHVGKGLRGRSRAQEHRAVLAELAELARDREVDLVLIAGDLFDSAAPTAEAEKIVYDALVGLAATGAPIVIVAGNHDNPQRLEAVRPLLELTRVHVAPAPARPNDGGVIRVETRSGEAATIALLPFLSQRGIVRADDLMRGEGSEHAGLYADRAQRIVGALCADLPSDTVNILLAHVMVHGGVLGGGERSAHTVFDYSVPATAFPPSLHYAALGHLHRAQRLPGACPIWYCGSPLQLDFGETEDAKSLNLIEAEPGRPARTEQVALRGGRPLRILRGTPEQLSELASAALDAYLRVEVDSPPGPGLADRIREMFPGAVDVQLTRRAGEARSSRPVPGGAPQELFAEYLRQRGEDDPRLRALFAELLEEAHEACPA